jgi:DNA invertase Pin-like site-specific DNA recombinase
MVGRTHSVGALIELHRKFARERAGWTIVGEFSDITTRRSANMLPGLRQAMAEAAAGRCDIVLVDSLDRVSRRPGRSLQHSGSGRDG